MQNTQLTSRRYLVLALMSLILSVCLAGTVAAQGSIFGNVRTSSMSTPPDDAVLFFGFVGNTDNEVRVISSVGAGYESGNWYDDFQNYNGATAGVAYQFSFFDMQTSESGSLTGLVPDNSFQQEDVTLVSGAWPSTASSLRAELQPDGSALLQWSGSAGVTWHVYRREVLSNGALHRIDNPAGDLADRGIADTSFVDATAGDVIYSYAVVGENDGGVYSPLSEIITAGSGSCCVGRTGDVDGSNDGLIDVADLQIIISYLFITYEPPDCLEAANTDGSPDGMVDVSDLQRMISYLFITYEPTAMCP